MVSTRKQSNYDNFLFHLPQPLLSLRWADVKAGLQCALHQQGNSQLKSSSPTEGAC